MKWFSFPIIIMLLLSFLACGGNSNSTPTKPAIGVSVSPNSSVMVAQGQTKAFTAALSNDTASQGVSWSLASTACSGSSCGTLSGSTVTTTTYNAPASVAANMTVNLVATAVADTSKTATVAISVMAPPSVTTTSMPNATKGTAYSQTLAASGGMTPLAWTISSGALPAGLTLNGTTGAISGTPTTVGTASFTVQLADAMTPPQTATKALSITVVAPPLSVSTSSLSPVALNSAYSATLAASGGTPPFTWSVTTGALPAWATLNPSTGDISGTATGTPGTTNFTVTATDSASTPQTASKALSITVNSVVAIATTSLPGGVQGTAYSQTLAASGGTPPFSWAVSSGNLPDGLSLNSGTGVINGTPTTAATANFTIQVSDNSTPLQTDAKALSISIAAAPLSITSNSLPNATIGTAYSTNLSSTGGTAPVSWSITTGALPAWASLNANTGVISGTPSGSPGTANFTVTATDSGTPVQTVNKALSIATVSGGVNNSELNGHYAFVVSGFGVAAGEFGTRAASFAADGNGNITGGVMDFNSMTTNSINETITSGFYSVGADNRGTLSLTTASGTTNYAFALGGITGGVANYGRIIASVGRVAAGVLKKQDPSAFGTSFISGSFAVQMAGMVPAGPFGAIGVFTFDGAGNFTASVDANEAGTLNGGAGLATPESFGGTISVTDTTNGRGVIHDTTNGSHQAFYVISANKALVIHTDPYSSTSMLFMGTAQKQSGPFSNASMNGTSVIAIEGQSGANTTHVQVGLLTTDGAGHFTVGLDDNDSGTFTNYTQNTLTGTYNVASNGRMSVSSGGQHDPVFYLVGNNQAIILGTGGVDLGYIEPQSGAPFSNSSISGNYIFGTDPPMVPNTRVGSGVVAGNGLGAVTGTEDYFNGATFGTDAFTDSYSVTATGRVTLQGSVMYLIAPGKAMMMSTTDVASSLQIIQQ